MSRAERIERCEQQAQQAELAAKSAPDGRKQLYLNVAEGWRSLAEVLARS
jgi:hypothetical protein